VNIQRHSALEKHLLIIERIIGMIADQEDQHQVTDRDKLFAQQGYESFSLWRFAADEIVDPDTEIDKFLNLNTIFTH
jgi:hypothetical protein